MFFKLMCLVTIKEWLGITLLADSSAETFFANSDFWEALLINKDSSGLVIALNGACSNNTKLKPSSWIFSKALSLMCAENSIFFAGENSSKNCSKESGSLIKEIFKTF